MAVPSSGELRLYADIGVELGVSQSNVSLRSMSDSAGFTSPDSMSDFYGYVDAVAPSVTTNAISNVGETTLRANGNVTSDGGGTVTERGFYVGTNSASPTNNAKYTVSGTTGSYLRDVSGLSANTTYYVWAFATNLVGTTYGSRVQSTTIPSFAPQYYEATKAAGELYTQNSYTYVIHHYDRYYIHPYTGGYFNYYSETEQAGNDSAFYTYFSPSNPQFCTNAQNAVQMRVRPWDSTASTGILSFGVAPHWSKSLQNRSVVLGGNNGNWLSTTYLQITNNSTGAFDVRRSNSIGSYSDNNIRLIFDYN